MPALAVAAAARTALLMGIVLWTPVPAHRARDSSRRNPHNQVEVFSLRVDCIVTSRFVHTVTSSKVWNKGNSSQEVHFHMELPKTAFITNFTMLIDGRSYGGEVKEKEKAKLQYDKAVSQGQTAGLVKASGRKMETFSVSVSVAANSSATFILTHEELLQRKGGAYEVITRIKMAHPVHDFQIQADIFEPQGLSSVDASASFLTNDLLPLVEKRATATTKGACPRCENSVIDGDFIITYDVKRDKKLGELQVVNGYFVHFFSPPDLARVPKNVVFVIDVSGSMAGTKISQTRDAMEAILKDLHGEDHFGIILFDSSIVPWRKSLSKATSTNVGKAVGYIRKIKDKGATDINAALLKAVKMLKRERVEGKLPERSADTIILLTDGMPNHGERNTSRIQQNVKEAAAGGVSLFCLGFGNDVDYSFLNVLSQQNNGLARRIYQASDAVLQLQGFYEEVSSPLLLDVHLRYPEHNVTMLTRTQHNQLFNGSEIVVAGQLTRQLSGNQLDNFIVEVHAQGPEEDFQEEGGVSAPDWNTLYPHLDYVYGDFTQRLWAYLTIRQLLEQSVSGSQQVKAEVEAEVLSMSLRFNFVTPLTSLVVSKPEVEDRFIADKLTEEQRQRAERRGGPSSASSSPQSQRKKQKTQSLSTPRHRSVSNVDGDPHFLIQLPDRDDALCFNINDKPGTIFNLVSDPRSGFVVNGQIIGRKNNFPDGSIHSYFGRFGIVHQELQMKVSTANILLSIKGRKWIKLLWSDPPPIPDSIVSLSLINNCSLTVTLTHSLKFLIIRHTKVWKRRRHHQDYLGYYALDGHQPLANGLLGQFYRGLQFEVDDVKEVQEKMEAVLYVNGQFLNVTRHQQKDFSRNATNGDSISCWFVDQEGAGLLEATPSYYIRTSLFATS